MVSAALLLILTLAVTSVSALSDTSWNPVQSATPAVAIANNISETRQTTCVISNNWVTPNFRPADCEEAVRKLFNARVHGDDPQREFMYQGDARQTTLPVAILPEVFTHQSCTIRIWITRYYPSTRIPFSHLYPRTEVSTYFRVYRGASAIIRRCLSKPPQTGQPKYAGYSMMGAHKGILITVWDTDSTTNRRANLDTSSIASNESVVASPSLPTMDSIVAAPSTTFTASDISLVPPVTGVPDLTNSRSMDSAPVEAA